ncbi:MAG: hypothetical protein ABSC17_09790 [Thermacetogeniaceae bacterium]
MIVLKPKRLVDKKAVAACRKEYSEISELPAYGEPHHIYPVSVGGPDHRYNLIQLDIFEHYGKVASGELTQDELLRKVAEREGIDMEEMRTAILRMMGRNV